MNEQPCIRGMRLTVNRVVEAVSVYPDRENLFRNEPELEPEDICQALGFAATCLEKQRYDIPGGTGALLMSSLTYPGGQAVSYSFDALGRLSGMTDSLNNTLVAGVQYGVANELKNLTYTPAGGLPGFGETRQYNELFQLKRLTVASGSTTLIDEGYNYPTGGQNNGRIDSKTDYAVFPNETTLFEYDDLNRLKSYQIGAGTVVQYSFDGFGNRLTEGGTSFGYDTSKNRLTQLGPVAGYYQYDANGNLTGVGPLGSVQSLAYDAENRMVSAVAATYPEYYGYAPDNKRVYKKRGDNQLEEFTFYVGNRRLGTGAIYDDQTTLGITITPEYWFGGKKLAVRDRLGSAVKTLPYGQERSGVVQNSDSFATYYRDKQTALDYADQRYYSASMGRFTSPDPYVASGGVGSPGSWNRYAYVEGDPVNFGDPTGRYAEESSGREGLNGCDPFWGCGFGDPFFDIGGSDRREGKSRSLACISGVCLYSDGACFLDGEHFAAATSVCIALAESFLPAKQKQRQDCPENIRNFFNVVIPIASGLADKWDTSTNNILALSAYESGWLGPHAQELRNLFGLTDAGGPNLEFKEYQDSADYWSDSHGKFVQHVHGITQFARSLQPHYNVKNPAWTSTLVDVYASVIKWRAICDK